MNMMPHGFSLDDPEEPCTPPHQRITACYSPPPAPKRPQNMNAWENRPQQDSLELREFFLSLPAGELLTKGNDGTKQLGRKRSGESETCRAKSWPGSEHSSLRRGDRPIKLSLPVCAAILDVDRCRVAKLEDLLAAPQPRPEIFSASPDQDLLPGNSKRQRLGDCASLHDQLGDDDDDDPAASNAGSLEMGSHKSSAGPPSTPSPQSCACQLDLEEIVDQSR